MLFIILQSASTMGVVRAAIGLDDPDQNLDPDPTPKPPAVPAIAAAAAGLGDNALSPSRHRLP